MGKPKLVFILALLLGLGLVCGQDVGVLRESPAGLPVTQADQEVLNLFFGALSAVQVECDAGLIASLQEEDALGACAKYEGFAPESRARELVELEFLPVQGRENGGRSSWLSPWHEKLGFGVVRQLWFEGENYYLGMNARSLVVVRFLE